MLLFCYGGFDDFTCFNLECLFILIFFSDPFLLLAKETKDVELRAMAETVKVAPKLISIDEATVSRLVQSLRF